MNLVGHQRWQDIMDDLVLDTFPLADFLQTLRLPNQPECWDFGAGAGLPGIPLRLLWHEGRYTMVEVREKRALFMQTVLALCVAQHTFVFRGRVEDFMAQSPPADLLLSRAFMPWEQVLDLLKGHLSLDGHIVFMALDPAPQMPEGWTLIASGSYTVPPLRNYGHGAPRTRYLWAVKENRR